MKAIKTQVTRIVRTGRTVILTSALVLMGIVTVQTATPSTASAAPFTCDNKFYQVIQGNLHTLDPVNGSYTQIATTGSTNINAIGYNIEDNYIYGINNSASWGSLGELVRFEHDGTVTQLGVPVGLTVSPGRAIDSGVFDASGNLWVLDATATGGNTSLRALQRIDVSANTATTVTSNIPLGFDIVYANNKLYGISLSSNTLTTYDITTNTYDQKAVSGLPTSSYGAAWYTSDGKMFFSQNGNGTIYEITDYDTPTPSATAVLHGEVTNNNDAANCPTATSPIPVSIQATDDDYSSRPIKSTDGGTVGNIFANDRVNTESVEVRKADVQTTVTNDGGLTGVAIDSDGNVTVPANTPVGTYHVTYQLCLVNDPTTCDTAVITIVVNEDGTLTPDTTAPNTGAQLLDLKSPLVPLSLAGLALAAVAARRYLK